MLPVEKCVDGMTIEQEKNDLKLGPMANLFATCILASMAIRRTTSFIIMQSAGTMQLSIRESHAGTEWELQHDKREGRLRSCRTISSLV